MSTDPTHSTNQANGNLTAMDPMKGILWMLIYGLFISMMHVTIRHVSADMHPFEIAFFRNLFALIAIGPWFIKLGWSVLKTDRPGMMIARGGVNTLCMLGYFTAITIAPLAEVTALGFTAPIYTTLLAMLVFKERIGLRRWLAILSGFLGVFVVLRPGFQDIGTGQVLVLFSAMGWGICMLMIKDMARTNSSATITAWMSLVMAPLSLIPALFYWTWPSWEQLGWLALLGTLGGIGQMAMAQSLKVAPTHVVMPIDFSRLLIVAFFGFVFFGEVPDAYVWLGGIMIFAATAFIAYREHVLKQANLRDTP